jgi:SAM-dependent methyltransferase
MPAPGVRDFVLAMIASLGIDKKMGLLEIGAGLGGSTRIIAKETGAWVSGLEPDAALAKAGMELSGRAKLKKRAPIEHCDLANLDLEPGSYPVIFSLATFYKAPDKANFYGRLYKALKSEGQLQFTDLMVPEPSPPGRGLREMGVEGVPDPPSLDHGGNPFVPRISRFQGAHRRRRHAGILAHGAACAEPICQRSVAWQAG